MPRRPDERHIVWCPLTLAEREIIDDVKRRFGLTSDANLFRTVFWSWLDDQEVECPAGAFDLREHGGWNRGQKTERPKVQKRAVIRRKPKKPAPNHPWRGKGL